jgi:hypothetical protein
MASVITNQKSKPASVVEMDAGKFLHLINVGAQAQIALFAERIQRIGEEAGANWRLVSLHGGSLLFEDVDQKKYYQADIQRLNKGRIKIGNISELRITENKKENTFRKNLGELVDAISEDNISQADSIFNRLMGQRFRSSVVPQDGVVVARDGIARYVNVAKSIVDDKVKPNIIKAISEALQDSVRVSRGRIVEAVFNNSPIKFPVSELTRRRVVARAMKSVAEGAYQSDGFQNRIKHLAGLVSENKVEDAVKIAAEFLVEDQEFSLLNLTEMQSLVGNALAAQGCFNTTLGDDVGKLLYRTNCRINKDTIVENWRETARRSEYAPLVENVRTLTETKDFEADYQDFLHMIFMEDMTTKTAKAKMYLNALKDMRNVLEGSESDPELIESLDQYIVRLEGFSDEVDDATLMEVEELVASTSETLMDDIETLQDYSKIPEPPKVEPEMFGKDLGAAAGDEGGLGGPELPMATEDLDLEDIPAEEGTPPAEETLADSKKTETTPISEAKSHKGKKLNKKEVCEAIGKLNATGLKAELEEWKKNASKFFEEDGAENAALQLRVYVEHAKKLNESELVTAFNEILVEHVSVGDLPEVEEDPYAYKAVDVKIDHNYGLQEDCGVADDTVTQTKPGGQVGSKEPAKGDAMGEAGEPNMNVDEKALHAGSKLKSKKTASESVCCSECKGNYDMAECMTAKGAACPECGASMDEQIMEALELANEDLKGCGHKMDRVSDGKGVAATTPKQSDGRGDGGKKDSMGDLQDGKGVAAKSPTESDGAKVGGKKDTMSDLQDGEGVAEDQFKTGTKRRRFGMRRSSLSATEGKTKKQEGLAEDQTTIIVTDKPVDDVISKIVSNMAQDDVMEPEVGLPDEGIPGEEMPGDVGIPGEEIPGEGMPGADGMPGEGEEMPGDEMPDELEGGLEGGEEEAHFPGESEEEHEEHEASETPEEEAAEHAEGESEKEEKEEVEEGKLPEALKAHMFKKKGADKEGGEKEDKADGEDKKDGEKSGKPWEKGMTEDNDITAPTSKDYSSEQAARKDGSGKPLTQKPKIVTKDNDGTKPAKTAKPVGGK